MSRSIRIVWLTLVCLSACVTQTRQEVGSRYFTAPQEAVIRISELLRNREWKTLSEYYDLYGSGVERDTLHKEEFFIRSEPPPNPDPAGLWRYRHPFPAGFVYLSDQATSDANILTVTVMREIDQGGGPKQRVLSNFKMRRSARGLQILPP